MAMTKVYCEACEGGGLVDCAFCPTCDGKGYVERDMAELVAEEECREAIERHPWFFEVLTDNGRVCLNLNETSPADARAMASNLFRAADEAEGKR